jgi:hypothetical protein
VHAGQVYPGIFDNPVANSDPDLLAAPKDLSEHTHPGGLSLRRYQSRRDGVCSQVSRV